MLIFMRLRVTVPSVIDWFSYYTDTVLGPGDLQVTVT